MAFSRHYLKYEQLRESLEALIDHLNKSDIAYKIQLAGEEEYLAYMISSLAKAKHANWGVLANYLLATGYIRSIPNGENSAIWIFIKSSPFVETISPTHVRLPKLSHLITLTPADFFLVLKLIATAADVPPYKTAISLRLQSCGIDSLKSTSIEHFFTLLRTNYRINPDYADKKWTPRSTISQFAFLEATLQNQFSVMQYLTIIQNEDILYFPIATAVELELTPIDEITEDYCVPPRP